MYDANFKFPNNPGLLILLHEFIKAKIANILTQKSPDKQANPGDAVYSFLLLVEKFAPKKGLTSSCTK